MSPPAASILVWLTSLLIWKCFLNFCWSDVGSVFAPFPNSLYFHSKTFFLSFSFEKVFWSCSHTKCLSVSSGPGTKWELLMCSLISDCSEGLSSEHRAEMSERPWSLWARLDKSHESFLLLSHSHLQFYTSVSVQRSHTSCSSEPELWAVHHLRSESEADAAVIYKDIVAGCNFHLMWVLRKLQLEHFRLWWSHKTCHCIADESFNQWWSADKTHVSVQSWSTSFLASQDPQQTQTPACCRGSDCRLTAAEFKSRRRQSGGGDGGCGVGTVEFLMTYWITSVSEHTWSSCQSNQLQQPSLSFQH